MGHAVLSKRDLNNLSTRYFSPFYIFLHFFRFYQMHFHRFSILYFYH
ncbi:hypothetical protein AHF37_09330 [Paragonimus kellicotti]|nr:hypothetical protein AHF37_09330 [Paragonimus kellicotti]